MRGWLRYTLCAVAGLAIGSGAAIYQVRSADLGRQVTNGPWSTNTDNGTADASALARARVALFGLLALPAKEAMYYVARTDSSGAALDGRCTYVVAGTDFDARWWSLTLYRGEGWLVPNATNIYSAGSGSLIMMESKPAQFAIRVGPDIPAETNGFIPTGGVPAFDLTLRVYHPQGALLDDPARARLPSITKERCA
jgi:hypothetical protein